jgi:hypothetical protein
MEITRWTPAPTNELPEAISRGGSQWRPVLRHADRHRVTELGIFAARYGYLAVWGWMTCLMS